MTAADTRAEIDHVRKLLLSGAITLDQAKEQTRERIAEMNARGKEIASRHGKKFRPFTFTSLMR